MRKCYILGNLIFLVGWFGCAMLMITAIYNPMRLGVIVSPDPILGLGSLFGIVLVDIISRKIENWN
jgi:hypothetical protein